mgnify:CR=1 FL=1
MFSELTLNPPELIILSTLPFIVKYLSFVLKISEVF